MKCTVKFNKSLKNVKRSCILRKLRFYLHLDGVPVSGAKKNHPPRIQQCLSRQGDMGLGDVDIPSPEGPKKLISLAGWGGDCNRNNALSKWDPTPP